METGSNSPTLMASCTTTSGTRCAPFLRKEANGSTVCVSSLPTARLIPVSQAQRCPGEEGITPSRLQRGSLAQPGIRRFALPRAWARMCLAVTLFHLRQDSQLRQDNQLYTGTKWLHY